MAYRVRCLMLATFSVTTFASTPQGFADPRPFIPPLASCHNYGVCPSRTAACIGLPYIPACDPAVNGGAAAGPAWNLTLQEAVNTAMANSEAVRNLGLVEAASKNDIVRSLITTYDPMEADALAAAEWGIFDPVFTVEALWDRQNVPPGTSFSGIGNRPLLGVLGVEDSQRVALEPRETVLRQRTPVGFEMFDQRRTPCVTSL